MEALLFKATSISDAWFQLVYALMRGTVPRNIYTIQKGSYVGQRRLEFPYVTVQIDRPFDRPLIPEMPPQLNLPPVASQEYVDDYFANYLMDPGGLTENETYKYSTWLAPGVERVIEQLKEAPGNNQATISIGGWAPTPYSISLSDHGLPEKEGGQYNVALDTDNFIDPATGERDPSCLRCVDLRLDQNNTLHTMVYFRSWDLFSGFAPNLAGLQMVAELVAQEIGAKPGKIIAASKGLHIYDSVIQVAAKRLGMADVGTMDDLLRHIDEERRDD